jgi:hypothetical protein
VELAQLLSCERPDPGVRKARDRDVPEALFRMENARILDDEPMNPFLSSGSASQRMDPGMAQLSAVSSPEEMYQ